MNNSLFSHFQQFDKAAEDVKNLKSSPSDADLLELYANFKQATVGDCNTGKLCRKVLSVSAHMLTNFLQTDKPGFLDFKGKAKWEAWNAKKGVTKDAAMEAYVQKANSLIESIGLK